MSIENDYANRVVVDFMENITDHVFLYIQNNEKLMRDYQTAVHQTSLQAVNTAIGKSVKEIFELSNTTECKEPKSWLIKSFMRHEKP